MLIALAVGAVDRGQSLLQLVDVGLGTSIEGFLNDRVFGTRLAPKGTLQGRVGTQARIDFDQAVCATQDGNQGIIEFVAGRMLHGFLLNLDQVAYWAKQVTLLQYLTKCGQACTGRQSLADGIIAHDRPPCEGGLADHSLGWSITVILASHRPTLATCR